MSLLSEYLKTMREIRATGAATAETSYYPALSRLLTDMGRTLKPRVTCVLQLQNRGAGMPDGGLFTPDQMQRGGEPQPSQVPSRGVIEVKGPEDDLDALAASRQVRRYLDAYGQVLISNYRAFRLLVRDPGGSIRTLERYTLAGSAAEFWTRPVAAVDGQHRELFPDFLKRVLLYAAPLAAPEDVAWILASYAREARARVEQHPLGSFRAVKDALQEALGITFEGERGEHFFRSTLVQTLFYGVFSAWVVWSRHEGLSSSARFEWRLASQYLRVPVLRKLFHEVSEPGQLNAAQLTEVLALAADALNRVVRAEFFRVFSEQDAVAYFYEPFLEAFDTELRKDLGVWYTPSEIVQYMVERIDHVLRTELGRADGLASPDVYVLDPCCGTGAYLYAVIERIARTLRQKHGDDPLLGHDLKQAALQRVFGFEILPAPFVIAHLQLSSQLEVHGAPLDEANGERAQVFLTNALTGWEPPREPKRLPFVELEEERDSAERVKQQENILVVLGNPPYNSFAGVSHMEEERDLSTAYRTVERVAVPQGHGLNDLYVRFFRMAERRIVGNRSGQGIVCFISNYSWLDGLSHTGMRERYLSVFDRIWIDNLNGDKFRTGKVTPEGLPDPSVFSTPRNREGIQPGTAISLLVRRSHRDSVDLQFRELWGTGKLRQLQAEADGSSDAAYARLEPSLELGLPFAHRVHAAEYLNWPRLPELFPMCFPGVKTSRDPLVVDIDRERLEARMRQYLDPATSHEQMARLLPSVMENTSRYDARAVRERLQERHAEGFPSWQVVRFCYRPFDVRWLYWEPETKLLDEKREDYVGQMVGNTLWIEGRQRESGEQFCRGTVTKSLADNFGNGLSSFFPKDVIVEPHTLYDNVPRLELNLSDAVVRNCATYGLSPEDVFFHAIAIVHAPAYREENAGALRSDWPRIPLSESAEALAHSATLGRRLAEWLDPESAVSFARCWHSLGTLQVAQPPLDVERDLRVSARWGYLQGTKVMAGPGRTVTRPWDETERQAMEEMAAEHGLSLEEALAVLGETAVDVFLNGDVCWRGVPVAVWEYTLGGYQVLKKWLSYRDADVLGRALRPEEARYFGEVVRRIASILLLGDALNASYRRVCLAAATGPA